MSVHIDISKHSQDQHQRIRTFLELDSKREYWIETALNECKDGKPFGESVQKINDVTKEMNEISRKGIVPLRENVTVEMIVEYCNRK
ncbi:DUF2533 family protein [Alkalihalobacillus sp. AL-G]|uniref:DUF2533 family protein n=1 Tax=Alkalihalobacillus sp. AL-G TaxID=2926399 RepID=UPI002729EB4F|nr:DUF2533 family protein [Alkalihalobacillus sp. AL-G]WLD95290.1 YpbS family protein [Alkalihalobacillus sp. AL-G]